jgi:DNA-nicking Smr family endonuclease
MEIDLHGYHPSDIVWNGVLAKIVQQAWEMGERRLCLIHGHGRNRGITPGVVNTNSQYQVSSGRSPYRKLASLKSV